MEYKTEKLSNHLEFKNGKKKPNELGKYPVFGGNGIFSSSNEFNDETTIIIGRVGAYCGSVHFSKNKCWVSDNAISAKVKNQNADILYFYYLLKNTRLNKMSIGTSQPLLTQNILNNILTKVFDTKIQRQISCILSALDQKIKTNDKIIANLEEQAQAIFRSWFVDFEPFQDGKFVESELGLIPEGWKVGKLGKSKLGKLIRSGIDDFEGEKIYIATADVSDANIIKNDVMITVSDRPSRANMQPRPLSVWFAKMKDSRKLILVNDLDRHILDSMIFSTGFAGIAANPNSVFFLWTYLISNEFDRVKNSYCQGTTMQAINNTNINKILIIVPADEILEMFSNIVRPMFDLVSKLKYQNQKLAETRDTLLPKLMSGEIDVSGINIDTQDESYE
ncbi:MAG: hypothetical protein GX367_05435 [Bacteroidales bacterium]|nr:hypothetical protein [Bacteroidales bacterium]